LKSLEINEEIQNQAGRHNALHNIGIIFTKLDNHVEALDYFFKALEIREALGDFRSIATSWESIGNIYDLQAQDTLALEYYNKSILLYEHLHDNEGVVSNYNRIGNIYLKNKSLNEAKTYASKALTLAQSIGVRMQIKKSYEILFEIAKTQKDYEKAVDYLSNIMIYKDSLFSEERQSELGRIAGKYETEQKIIEDQQKAEEMIALKEQEKSRQKNLQYMAIGIGIIVLFVAIVIGGKFNISAKVASFMIFLFLLFGIQFIIILIRPFLGKIAGDSPFLSLITNIVMVLLITHVHIFLDKTLKSRIIKEKEKADASLSDSVLPENQQNEAEKKNDEAVELRIKE